MRDHLRIGIFTNQYPGVSGAGGIATYTRSLATALAALGEEVHVLTPAEDGENQNGKPRLIDGVHIHTVKTDYLPFFERFIPGARSAWMVSAAARKLVRDYKLDIFEFPNWEGAGRFFKTAPGPRVPMVVRLHTSVSEIHEIEETKMGFAERFACRLETAQCRAADALYVSTRAHRDRMAPELRVPASKISVLPLGVPDIEHAAGKTPRPRRAAPTLLYLGRLEKRKGVLDLLHAMPAIVRKIPNVRLVLIGKDRQHAPGKLTHCEYFSCAFPPELQKHVIFAGFLSDSEIAHWFEQADAFVAPSIYESFGLIFIEAMRWSLPVIGTFAGGIPEVVNDGVNGMLVEPGAPEQIALAATRLLTDDSLRLKMAAAARATYEDKFSNRVMAQRTIEHYRGVIQNDPRQTGSLRLSAPRKMESSMAGTRNV